MRNIQMAILLALSVFVIISLGAQTNALNTGQLAFVLQTDDDSDIYGHDQVRIDAKERIRKSIDSAGPEIISLIAATIHEFNQHIDIVYGAYGLLSEKIDRFGVRDNTCRDIVLEHIDDLIKPDDSYGAGLPTILATLLGKCGRTEDAPILLDVMRNNENPYIKIEAAKSAAKIGDANTLIEMKKVYAALQTGKLAPYWQQREKYFIKTNNTLVLVMNPHFNPLRHPYLDNILLEISNLERRVESKTILPGQSIVKSPQIGKFDAGSQQVARGFTARAYLPLAWLFGAVVLVSGALIFLVAGARKRRG